MRILNQRRLKPEETTIFNTESKFFNIKLHFFIGKEKGLMKYLIILLIIMQFQYSKSSV